jgi:hypothetical protein
MHKSASSIALSSPFQPFAANAGSFFPKTDLLQQGISDVYSDPPRLFRSVSNLPSSKPTQDAEPSPSPEVLEVSQLIPQSLVNVSQVCVCVCVSVFLLVTLRFATNDF